MDSKASLTSRHFLFQVCLSLLVDHWPEPKLDVVPALFLSRDSQQMGQCSPRTKQLAIPTLGGNSVCVNSNY